MGSRDWRRRVEPLQRLSIDFTFHGEWGKGLQYSLVYGFYSLILNYKSRLSSTISTPARVTQSIECQTGWRQYFMQSVSDTCIARRWRRQIQDTSYTVYCKGKFPSNLTSGGYSPCDDDIPTPSSAPSTRFCQALLSHGWPRVKPGWWYLEQAWWLVTLCLCLWKIGYLPSSACSLL